MSSGCLAFYPSFLGSPGGGIWWRGKAPSVHDWDESRLQTLTPSFYAPSPPSWVVIKGAGGLHPPRLIHQQREPTASNCMLTAPPEPTRAADSPSLHIMPYHRDRGLGTAVRCASWMLSGRRPEIGGVLAHGAGLPALLLVPRPGPRILGWRVPACSVFWFWWFAGWVAARVGGRMQSCLWSGGCLCRFCSSSALRRCRVRPFFFWYAVNQRPVSCTGGRETGEARRTQLWTRRRWCANDGRIPGSGCSCIRCSRCNSGGALGLPS